jgi:hypothetical protein
MCRRGRLGSCCVSEPRSLTPTKNSLKAGEKFKIILKTTLKHPQENNFKALLITDFFA